MMRWDPWRDLFALQGEMSRLVQESWLGTSDRRSEPVAYLPIDVRQTDGEFVLEASVPGFNPEEIEVTAERGVLTIRGEHRSETKSDGEYLRRERRQTSFFRQLSLPQAVREDGISASFQNGVLSVRLPKAELPAPKRIPVAVESAPALETAASEPEKAEVSAAG